MPTFTYTAIGAAGRVSGELEASTRQEAYRKLDQSKLQPVNLTQKSGVEPLAANKKKTGTAAVSGELRLLSGAQIILFTEELSDLLEAGLQLEPALRIMEGRDEISSLKEVVTVLRQQVREGRSFSASLRNTSPSFGELYCNLAQAGEASGALPQILKRQVRYLTMIDELQSRVVQALIYPAFISLAGIVMIGVFMTVLVPQMTQLLTKTGQSMPFATRVLVASSGFLSHWWWAILLTIGGTVGTFVAYIKTEAGRLWWAEAQLKMPGVGPIMVSRFYVQFTQTLSTLVGNGIPLLNGLKLMTDATQNYYLRHLLEKIVLAVGEGGAFSRALKKVGHFPPLFIDMVTVGEQTGDMGLALEKVATRYDKELNRKIQTITALVQPVIIVAIALVVGLVAYAMVSGIFQMISGMRHRM